MYFKLFPFLVLLQPANLEYSIIRRRRRRRAVAEVVVAVVVAAEVVDLG